MTSRLFSSLRFLRLPSAARAAAAILLAATTAAFAVTTQPVPPSLTATESVTRAVATTRGGGVVSHDQKETWRLNFTAKVPVAPGHTLDSNTIATMLTNGGLSVTIGDYNVTAGFPGAAVVLKKKTAVVTIPNEGDTTQPSGTITVVWSDTGFTVTGSLGATAASLIYAELDPAQKRIADVTGGAVEISGSLDGGVDLASVEWQSVKLTGSQNFVTRSFQDGDFLVGKRSITATADNVRPSLTILSPAAINITKDAAKAADADVVLSGVAADNREVDSVMVVMDGGEEQSADLTYATTPSGDDNMTHAKWSFDAGTLESGTHVFQVYSVDQEGLRSAVATRRITYVKYVNLKLTLDGTGTVTPSFLNAAGNVTRRQVGQSVTITATPTAGAIFAGWSGDLDGLDFAGATLTFRVPDLDTVNLTAHFVANPFQSFGGDYTVQFGAADDATSLDSIGAVTFTMSPTGMVTGKLVTSSSEAGVPFIAQVTGNGTLAIDIPYQPLGKNQTAAAVKHIHLELTLDLSDPTNPDISGTVVGIDPSQSDSIFEEDIAGYRKVWSAANPVDAALQGAYNVVLSTDASDANGFTLPPGFVSATLAANGTFSLSGVLPTGTAFTANPVLSPDGQIFIRQATPAGIVTGKLQVDAGTDAPEISGSLYLNYASYDEDLLQTVFVQVPLTVTGEPYVAPAPGQLAMPLSDGTGTITIATYYTDSGDVYEADLTKAFTLAADGSVTITDDNAENVQVQVNPATGSFTGTFTNPADGATLSFKGVLLQNAQTGNGQYTGGGVELDFNVAAISG